MKNSFSIMIFIPVLMVMFSCTGTGNNPRAGLNPKVWLHRANDPNKAKALQYKYSGMEIDVMYSDNGVFYIKHDEDEADDITLNNWLSKLNDVTYLGLWFDLKNLNKDNHIAAAKDLADIREKYDLQGKIYVESDNCEFLKSFEDRDFRVSYYIPWYAADSVADTIENNIKKYELKTISGYYDKYDFMKQRFSGVNKLIWYHKHDTAQRNYYINLANSEEKIDVILVADDDYK